MQKKMLLILSCVLINIARADSMAEFDNYNQNFLDARDIRTLNDLESLKGQALAGVAAAPGEVVFRFGSGHPTIVCSILEISDLAFEMSERIREVTLGDSARWNIESAISGNNQTRTEHLIIKPLAANLSTSMVVTTDRRTYHIRLKSSAKEFMPSVRFSYPKMRFTAPSLDYFSGENDSFESEAQAYSVLVDGTVQSNYASLDVYEISGDYEITPQKVWHDSSRTYIQMPKETALSQMPALMLVEETGLIFTEENLHSANYRIKGRTYIVDGIVKHARLLLGANNEGKSCDISLRG